MQLEEAERQAINDFLATHWAAFADHAGAYLSPEEIKALGEKLSAD